MINALGLLEVEGMVAAVDAADAMLKAANVRLLSHEVLDPGRLTLVVEGDLAACRAALDAGAAAARRTGCVISRREIGWIRPARRWSSSFPQGRYENAVAAIVSKIHNLSEVPGAACPRL